MNNSPVAEAGQAGLDPQVQPISQAVHHTHSNGNLPHGRSALQQVNQSVHSVTAVQTALGTLSGFGGNGENADPIVPSCSTTAQPWHLAAADACPVNGRLCQASRYAVRATMHCIDFCLTWVFIDSCITHTHSMVCMSVFFSRSHGISGFMQQDICLYFCSLACPQYLSPGLS